MIGIVILNFNNIEDTKKCIDSILSNENVKEYKIIVVDNASSQKVQNAIKYYLKSLTDSYTEFNENLNDNLINELPFISYYQLNENYGYARGNNKAMYLFQKDSTISYTMILNNDIVFIEPILKSLKQFLLENEDVAIVSPILLTANGNDIDYTCARRHKTITSIFISLTILKYIPCFRKKLLNNYILYGNVIDLEVLDIELPSGSCMLASNKTWKKIDFFDNNTFLYYEEDILYEKIKKNKLKNKILMNLQAIHLGGSTMVKYADRKIKVQMLDSLWYYMSEYLHCNPIIYYYLKIKMSIYIYINAHILSPVKKYLTNRHG